MEKNLSNLVSLAHKWGFERGIPEKPEQEVPEKQKYELRAQAFEELVLKVLDTPALLEGGAAGLNLGRRPSRAPLSSLQARRWPLIGPRCP